MTKAIKSLRRPPSEIDDRLPDTVWEIHWDDPDGGVGKITVIGYEKRQDVYRTLARSGASIQFRRVKVGSKASTTGRGGDTPETNNLFG